MRALHKVHDGPLEAVSDIVQGDGFYDDRRVRLRSDDLYRAYELLYPRDEKRISRTVLDIAGFQGLAALWCDLGRRDGNRLRIGGRFDDTEIAVLRDWAGALGFEPDEFSKRNQAGGLSFSGLSSQRLQQALRAQLPRCMHATLRR